MHLFTVHPCVGVCVKNKQEFLLSRYHYTRRIIYLGSLKHTDTQQFHKLKTKIQQLEKIRKRTHIQRAEKSLQMIMEINNPKHIAVQNINEITIF